MLRTLALFALLPLAPCIAQQWEIGGAAGYGFYRNQEVTRDGRSATAGFISGRAFSAVAGQRRSAHLGGELRYVYRQNRIRISSGQSSLGILTIRW